MNTVEKQAIPVIIDSKTNEPIAIIFYTQNRERIIYTLTKADEEDIMKLLVPHQPLLKVNLEITKEVAEIQK